jgi:hypothetical protein
MPCCANVTAEALRRAGRRGLLVAAMIAQVAAFGCTPAEQDFGFTIARIEARPAREGVELTIRQDIKLSREARDALVHGVPLVIRVELYLHAPGKRSHAWHADRTFEIRYLPLSDHYQLAGDEGTARRTYPRLRHALADLAEVRLTLPAASISGGVGEVRARTYLEKRELPPPMRLPTWFSALWRHDSGWQSQVLSLPEQT